MIRLSQERHTLKHWRDSAGPEIDWVIETNHNYIPIEVKWTESPTILDAKHLQLFLQEYSQTKKGFIICRTPHAMKISQHIIALPWTRLDDVF